MEGGGGAALSRGLFHRLRQVLYVVCDTLQGSSNFPLSFSLIFRFSQKAVSKLKLHSIADAAIAQMVFIFI